MLQRERAQSPLEVGAGGLHVVDEAAHQLIEDERRGARPEQVAAVGAAMIAGDTACGDAFRHERRADRHTAAERLADGDQVRPQAERLRIERIAGAAQAGLHFVGNVERAGSAADVVDGRGELRRHRADAALALDRLGNDRRRPR